MSQAPVEIQDIYVLVVRERDTAPENAQVIESVPPKTESDHQPEYVARLLLSFGILLSLSCILLQVYLAYNPPTATVTIMPKAQLVTLTGTLHLGRLLSPITLSQSQTVLTTGKGHQDARQATGSVTFYNGLFTSQTVATGTIVTGSDGLQVITDQAAAIPAGNPPSYGQVSVSAHALNAGVKGNIPAYDINHVCCTNAVLVKNTTAFTGGQDERDFQTVAQRDIDTAAAPLQTTLVQRLQAAMQTRLGQDETLQRFPCTPAVRPDHQPGQEAAHVQVTVSATCTGIAYNSDALRDRVTQLLATQAGKQFGTGYRLQGNVQVQVAQASSQPARITLTVTCQGVWVYQLSTQEEQQIKRLVAGKTKQQALHTLGHLPGIQGATMKGTDDTTRLPKNPDLIHLVILEQLG
jgi:hypothetical protein